ncbi:MAG TPA: hypothetical protein ENG59_04995 [Chloroflexi bacterium]|nr:MAG: hypothetical protein DRI46_00585 [Chloroflexota bacterium]HDD55576.1 hypothetical protein [Chloroflexota bacterium]
MEGHRLQIQEELLLAKQSRIEGNEGRARVCARRAAGAAAQGYFQKVGYGDHTGNTLESLATLKSELDLPERVLRAIEFLLQRVDLDHNLPCDVDLIDEAAIVIQYLENGLKDQLSPDS